MANGEIIEAHSINADVPAIADDQIIALAERAEKRIEAVNKLKKLALRVTNRHDWTDQQGKPYMQVSGAEKVARLFGISWMIGEPVMEHEESGHFSYTYKGTFSISGATIEVIGTRSSKDGFFKKYDYSKKDEQGNNIKTELPPSEIDKGDVKKAAFTNLLGNGISRLLGIRNLTWEDLAEAKITQEDVNKVDYKKGGKKQGDIKSEGAQVATFIPADIRKTSGTKNGKAWTKFVIKSPAGSEYGTFSETFATTAREGRDAGRPVEVTFKTGQYGNDIEGVKFADNGPADREPGSEG